MEQLRKDDRNLFQKIIDFFKKLFTASKGTQFEQDVRRIYDRLNGLLENVSEYDKNTPDTLYSIEKPHKNYYNEFNTLAMQWAYSASTNPGDVKIFNNKGKYFTLIQSTGDGYVELASGNYVEMKEEMQFYGDIRTRQIPNSIAEELRDRQNNDNWHTVNTENPREQGQFSEQNIIQHEQTDRTGHFEEGSRSDQGSKQDVRYSIPVSKYLELAKYPENNRSELQKMVQNAAKEWGAIEENGKPKVFYHGTDADFTVFDSAKGRSTMDIQGMFFSPWEIDAQGYGKNVGKYYLNIQNPAPERVAYKALNMFTGQNYAGIKARDYLISLGYDGVNNSDEEYIAFYPEQIKSADAVTYDDNGNVIPLSERFNQTNPDIRYSKGYIDILQAVADGDMTVEEANQQIKADKQQYKEKQAAKEESKSVSVANENLKFGIFAIITVGKTQVFYQRLLYYGASRIIFDI